MGLSLVQLQLRWITQFLLWDGTRTLKKVLDVNERAFSTSMRPLIHTRRHPRTQAHTKHIMHTKHTRSHAHTHIHTYVRKAYTGLCAIPGANIGGSKDTLTSNLEPLQLKAAVLGLYLAILLHPSAITKFTALKMGRVCVCEISVCEISVCV